MIEYVLSCHGNQNRYIVDRYKEFAAFVRTKTEGGFHITKDAGVFIARNDSKQDIISIYFVKNAKNIKST